MDNKKEQEIPFGAFDSELMHQEINIPEGFEATIEGNKIILKKTESEDEKIRKALIEYFSAGASNNETTCDIEDGKILAWLEKQKERSPLSKDEEYTLARIIEYLEDNDCPSEWKYLLLDVYALSYQKEQNDSDVKDYNSIDPHFGKPNDKVEPKFKVGDWVVWDNKISCHIDNIYQGKESLMYTITDDHNMTRSYSVKGFDNNAHLWTINDARDGDVLVDKWGNIGIYQGDTNAITWHSCCYCGVNKMFYDGGRHEFPCYPATKEQRDTLMKAMADAGWEFDFEKKELKKIEDEEYNSEDYGIDGLWHAKNILEETLGKVDGYQSDDGILEHKCAITVVNKLYKQKPDWGEEDERIYQSIIDDTVQENQLDSKQIDWLKSIKSRVQPKQELSEEDEKLVKWSINNLTELKDRFGEEYGKVGKCIDWLKSLIPQNHWKTSKEQMSRLKWIAHQKARRL